MQRLFDQFSLTPLDDGYWFFGRVMSYLFMNLPIPLDLHYIYRPLLQQLESDTSDIPTIARILPSLRYISQAKGQLPIFLLIILAFSPLLLTSSFSLHYLMLCLPLVPRPFVCYHPSSREPLAVSQR
jgi:hypothetical protein